MKKYGLLLCTFLLLAFAAQAQDVITLVNGTVVHCKVVQITPTLVICTDSNNPDRKIDIKKSGIATVAYASGSTTRYNLVNVAVKGRNNTIDTIGVVNGWYFGITASGGPGTVTSNDPNYTTGAVTTGGGKILATGMINQHFGIQFGFGADVSGYKVNYIKNSIFSGTSVIYTQRYATLPLRLLYLSNSKRRIGFYAVAGMDLSILTSASDNVSDFLSSYYSDLLLSPYGSCGIVARNRTASCIWMLGPYYKTSLNNIYSQQHIVWKDETLLSTGNTGNFTSMGVTLSFMTNFSKWGKNGY